MTQQLLAFACVRFLRSGNQTVVHGQGRQEEKGKHVYTRSAKFRLFHMQGAAIDADGSLYRMGIYPQLHVDWFPRLTAPR